LDLGEHLDFRKHGQEKLPGMTIFLLDLGQTQQQSRDHPGHGAIQLNLLGDNNDANALFAPGG
jgi:hypothetical protein